MELKNRRKRILMIAPEPFFEPRGTPFSVLWRLKALSHIGYEVDLLTYPVGQDVKISGVRIIRPLSIPFIKTVPVGPSWKKCFFDVLLIFRAIRLLFKEHYDLLHTHEEASIFGVALAKAFRVRHLYDMHSSLPQQLSNFQYTGFQFLIRLFEWLERLVINSSDAVITICPALEDHVKKINRNILGVMIENFASGEDAEGFSEEDVENLRAAYSNQGKKIVLYTGTFEPYQGLDLLIASAEQVIRRCQDVAFLLVGGTPEQVRYYRTAVDRLGLSPHFHFTGTRPAEEIPKFVRIAYLLVSPRVNGTNTPLKIYPYLHSGKPIVATNIVAHTQVLNRDIAVLVEPNPEAFTRGILSVLENQPLGTKLSEQAQLVCQGRFSYQTFIQKTEQVVQMAIG